MQTRLTPHPATPRSPLTSLLADAARPAPGLLRLTYRAEGALAQVVLPPAGPPERADELWRSTCFEAFLRRPSGESYVELNLAPSGRWAAYLFDAYREGMRPAAAPTPAIETHRTGEALALTATFDLSGLQAFADEDWRLALTAVVEASDGAISYWSLSHAPGPPDFHHPAGFVLDLPRAR
ncbi:DOMON-like domain-containing protein [Phenylobacterium sp.]|uniref:DOMON-like domain-containing protein n=1 Tax=Phenylobacterium sp. TaxID=1871053 RepID=UPI0035B3EEE3